MILWGRTVSRHHILQKTVIIRTSTDQGTYTQLSPKAGQHFLQKGQKIDYAKCPVLSQHICSPTDPSALLLEGPPPVLPGLALRVLLHFQNISHLDPKCSPPLAALLNKAEDFPTTQQ